MRSKEDLSRWRALDAASRGCTALHLAATAIEMPLLCGQTVRALLDLGVDPTVRDEV